jgi:hypothetical protein
MPSDRAPSSQSVMADRVGPDPGVERPREHVAWQLRVQAVACEVMGSPLYAELLDAAAADAAAGGPTWEVLRDEVAPGRGDALALRFMAAVHRLVLTRQAPALAVHYPSVGGAAGSEGAWAAFRRTLEGQVQTLRALVALPCQTNEVGRTAALVGGFLEVAAVTGMPLRVLEVGASAGLNLRWDRFRYSGGGATWGPADSTVRLTGYWDVPPPHTDAQVVVVERRGCDLHPVDPRSAEGRLALTAAVWADQVERFERLRGALAITAEVPAHVDRASAPEWVEGQLAASPADVATVVYHSIVEEYLPGGARARFHAVVREAGERARPDAPLAWLRLEPISELRAHGLTLTTWPGGRERILATCGAHGTDVVWRDTSAR